MTKATAVNNRGRRAVVVGVDGSVSAQGALAWAAAEASSRHCPLRIVHAFSWPMLSNPLDMTFVGDMNIGLQSAAEWILTEAESHAREVAPDIKVIANLFVGPAAPTLLNESQDADLVVVGSRGVGGFRGLLVGSVSATVAAHAPCPVVVVHPHGDGTAFPSSPTGRIVVGVDGSEISAAAIRFAFQQAARRHICITAVHAATPTRLHPSLRVPADIVDQIDRQLFAEAMESKRVLFPAIDVQTKLVHAHPAQALIDASARRRTGRGRVARARRLRRHVAGLGQPGGAAARCLPRRSRPSTPDPVRQTLICGPGSGWRSRHRTNSRT